MLTDFRFALRQLAKTPGFTVAALLTLAIGIGSATVVFSAINALLFKPLPFITAPEERLAFATQTDATLTQDLGWSYPDYRALRERSTTLAGVWIHTDRTVIIAGTERPERLVGTDISWDAFGLMGVPPLHGRGFRAADAAPGAENVALISAALWKRRYGGTLETIGTNATINNQPTTIIGVMPAGWRYPDFTDVWTPLRPDPLKPFSRGDFKFSGRALLQPGVSFAQARAEADTILGALEKEFPATNKGVGLQLRPIRAEAIENMQEFTLLLFGAVFCVFLIACVNVANLLLARGVTRSKEFAIRLALGADRPRVVLQLAIESIALGLLGGVGGILVALWGNDAMVAAMPIQIPFWLRFDFDGRVFAFVFGLSLVAAVLFGLVPALRSSRPDVIAELKEGGRSIDTSGPRAVALRSMLVIFQIAIALVLLVGAGLMMRSAIALRRTDPGFVPQNVLTFRTGIPPGLVSQEEPDLPQRFFQELLEKFSAAPGIESAALMSWRPTKDDAGLLSPVFVEGGAKPARVSEAPLMINRVVSASYFATMKIPLRAGRVFDDSLDRKNTRPVVVVDEDFARRHFGSPAAAVGKRVQRYDADARHGTENANWLEIIGVVGSVRHRLDQADKHPTAYISRQLWLESFFTVVLRTRGEPAAFIELARSTVTAVNREIPIYEEGPLADALLRSDTVWPRRFFGYLFLVFGGVALFLACVGIYGVMSYNVTQRVQELGVRLALGAQPREVIRLVLRHGLALVGWGLAIGLAAAALLANFMTGVLYGVSPHDPPTFALVPLLLAAVALVACWLPGRRATLIEPNAALRAE